MAIIAGIVKNVANNCCIGKPINYGTLRRYWNVCRYIRFALGSISGNTRKFFVSDIVITGFFIAKCHIPVRALFRQIIDRHFAYIWSCPKRLLINDCGWSAPLGKHFILKLALPSVTHASLAILKNCSLSSVPFVGLCSRIIPFLAVLEIHRRSFYTSSEAV